MPGDQAGFAHADQRAAAGLGPQQRLVRVESDTPGWPTGGWSGAEVGVVDPLDGDDDVLVGGSFGGFEQCPAG